MAEPKVPLKEGLKTVTEDTSNSGLDDALKGLGISKEEILANLPTTTTATDKVVKPKITLTRYPSVSSPTQATALINKVFESVLRRPATAEEMKKWKPLLKTAQEKNAATQSYKVKGTVGTQAATGGLDEETWLLLQLSNDPSYKEELAKVKFTDPALIKREQDKALYEKAVAEAGTDTTKLAELEASTTYGRGLKDLKDAIETARLTAGAELSDDEVNAIAQEAYDKGFDRERNSLNSFLDKKFKFTAEAAKGKAGEQLDDLQRVAAANGLDLQKSFGSQLPTWLASINKGESIDTYKKMIRNVAKIGMPQNVAALLDQGIDLDALYSPYKNIMASTLEINPQSITLNDPTLRSAITGDREIPIYEFERQLRQDSRWQYTNQAKEEVSNIALKVLKDFGFQG
jgi:hypothetical protein